jgi:hypothetical protein
MARTNKGQTPLHIAVEMAESQWLNREYNYGLTIKLLLGAGALINTADSIANTPLHVRPGQTAGQTAGQTSGQTCRRDFAILFLCSYRQTICAVHHCIALHCT